MSEHFLYQCYKEAPQILLNTNFSTACGNGELEKVKFLLISSRLKSHADIHYFDDMGFISACLYGKLEVVRYLLASPELKDHANINAQNDFAIRGACNRNDVNIIKYLLTSSELNKHANIHAENDDAFKNAFVAQNYEVLQYLIMEYQIKKTDEISKFLAKNTNQEVEEMFNLRELKQSLSKDLVANENIGKRLKL